MIFGGINLFLCYNIEVLLYVVYDSEMTILSMLYYGVGYDHVNGFIQS